MWDIASLHILKYVLLQFCTEAPVEITFHSNAVACNIVEGHINSVILSTKSGFVRVSAKNFIDASGDADLVKMCEAEYVKGSEPNCFDALTESGLNKSHFSNNTYGTYEKMVLCNWVHYSF